MAAPADDPKVRDPSPCIAAVFAQHLPRVVGKCPWCGLEQTDRTPVKKLLKFMHNACQAELDVIKSPGYARWHVWKRDHGICAECGDDYSQMYRFEPEHRDRITRLPTISYDIHGWNTKHEVRIAYTALRAVSLWHVDHKVPLWKVRHMPPLQRVGYFKLANLVTLCDRCHDKKTREENTDRGKSKRAVKPKDKPKTKWPKGRRLQGRGFSRGKRSMRRQ